MSDVVISHSEVDSFLLCPQRHFYAFGDSVSEDSPQGLEPKVFSDPLYRGIIGHKGLEMFYKGIQQGGSISDSLDAGITAVQAYAMQPNPKYDILTDLSTRIIPRFVEEVGGPEIEKGWRVKAVEVTYRLEIPTSMGRMVYPFTPDLIMRSPRHENVLKDHKFLYNFYNQSEINLLPQIPKYIGALRALSLPIHYGQYNMLRWRKVKDTSTIANFRQHDFTPTPQRLRHAFLLQVKGMERIAKLKRGTLDAWAKEVDLERVQNGLICKSCSFKELCAIDMSGGDSKLYKRVNYQPNTYGYADSEADGGD